MTVWGLYMPDETDTNHLQPHLHLSETCVQHTLLQSHHLAATNTQLHQALVNTRCSIITWRTQTATNSRLLQSNSSHTATLPPPAYWCCAPGCVSSSQPCSGGYQQRGSTPVAAAIAFSSPLKKPVLSNRGFHQPLTML